MTEFVKQALKQYPSDTDFVLLERSSSTVQVLNIKAGTTSVKMIHEIKRTGRKYFKTWVSSTCSKGTHYLDEFTAPKETKARVLKVLKTGLYNILTKLLKLFKPKKG